MVQTYRSVEGSYFWANYCYGINDKLKNERDNTPNIIDCTEDKNETTIDGNVSIKTVPNKEYGFMKVLNV